jgi:A/G-specific adenine glycosylase
MRTWTKLLHWYDAHGRDLPWRNTREPYRILISEIMLQQTQVSRVLEFYRRWLTRFPDWKTLAAATNAEVIHAWAGLGYNRRALVLRDIARRVTEYGLPKTRDEWLALKGIGPYTASALAAFSLRERVLPIDTNIRRTAGRILLGRPFPTPTDDARIERNADRLLPRQGRYFDIPQALFDLATSVCTKTPMCASCPLKKDCLAAPKFLGGRLRIPKQSIKKARETIQPGKKYPDRIYRGRILALIRKTKTSLDPHIIGTIVDPLFNKDRDLDWLLRMLDRLEKDCFIRKDRKKYRLY